MREYKPHAWSIIYFKIDDEEVYKVLCGWYSGYLYGDSWRLNSGIKEVIDKGDAYEFIGSSGSVYICNKKSEGMTGLMSIVYHNWENKLDKDSKIKIINAKEYCEST